MTSPKKIGLTSSITFDELLRAHGDKMSAAITVENVEGTGVASVSKDFFVTNMPTGVTVESYNAAMAYRDLTINGGSLALVEVGTQALHDHKDMTRVDLKVPTIGGSFMEGSLKRGGSYRHPKSGEQVSVFASLQTPSYTDRSSRGAGELKDIKRHLSEIAQGALSD